MPRPAVAPGRVIWLSTGCARRLCCLPGWPTRHIDAMACMRIAPGRISQRSGPSRASTRTNRPARSCTIWCRRHLVTRANGSPRPRRKVCTMRLCSWPAPRRAIRGPLRRAARELAAQQPDFAIGAGLLALHWLTNGFGYEVTGADVWAAYSSTIAAAEQNGNVAEVRARIGQIISARGPRRIRENGAGARVRNVIQRAFIDVAGPNGSGKTAVVKALLAADDGPTLVACCVRGDIFRRWRESSPRTHPEMQRYRQAGAYANAMFAFPGHEHDLNEFYETQLMLNHSRAVILEGDNPRATPTWRYL